MQAFGPRGTAKWSGKLKIDTPVILNLVEAELPLAEKRQPVEQRGRYAHGQSTDNKGAVVVPLVVLGTAETHAAGHPLDVLDAQLQGARFRRAGLVELRDFGEVETRGR